MHSVRNEFTLRLDEINKMLNFISDLESYKLQHSSGSSIEMTINTTLKSSVVLMLYNAIESTLTSTLKRLHIIIADQGIKFSEANRELRQLIITYYSLASKKNDVHRSSENLEQLICRIVEMHPLDLSFDELIKQYPLYSGNIDAKLVRKIFKKYGLNFETTSDELNTIKKYRNQLAHGERTFEECGREIPLSRLTNLRDKSNDFINDMILKVEDFCRLRGFMAAPNSTP